MNGYNQPNIPPMYNVNTSHPLIPPEIKRI